MDVIRRASMSDLPDPVERDEVFSVSEFISLLNIKLKPLRATIQGEMGQVKYSGKAVYFTLRDKNESILKCLIWLSRLNSLGIEPRDGLEVKIQGHPDVYAKYGSLTFQADVITPVGEGALRLAFEKLKTDLEALGYFRPERKRKIQDYIEGVGLITSETGVVQRDFLRGLGKRGIKIHFYDARVEGQNAIESIVTAIQWFNQNPQGVQALVIARGGGGLEQLQPFNSLEIAKAIYGSRIPVMTAIGHETDVTIADLVADVRASVPMDAGKRLADPWEKAVGRTNEIEQGIFSRFRSACLELDDQLNNYKVNYLSSYGKMISYNRKTIDRHRESLMRCVREVLAKIDGIKGDFAYNFERFSNALTSRRSQTTRLEKSMVLEAERAYTYLEANLEVVEAQFGNSCTRYGRYLWSLQQDITTLDGALNRHSRRWYSDLVNKLSDTERMLHAHDPHLKLKQGFSIVKDKTGKVIRSSKNVKVGDIIQTELYEGVLNSKVEKAR